MDKLSGGDLRSIGNADTVAKQVRSQEQFDELFEALFHEDRLIVMRAADAVEKVTRTRQSYLGRHKQAMFSLLGSAIDKELKWHLALMISRLKLTKSELGRVWTTLTSWALDSDESRIVRVNSIQSLWELSEHSPDLKRAFELVKGQLEREEIPSIRARIRKLQRASDN